MNVSNIFLPGLRAKKILPGANQPPFLYPSPHRTWGGRIKQMNRGSQPFSILWVLSFCVTCAEYYAPDYPQDATHHPIGDVANSKPPLLILPKVHCACALPAVVQLRLRVTRRS